MIWVHALLRPDVRSEAKLAGNRVRARYYLLLSHRHLHRRERLEAGDRLRAGRAWL